MYYFSSLYMYMYALIPWCFPQYCLGAVKNTVFNRLQMESFERRYSAQLM